MSNIWDETRAAIDDARNTVRAADSIVKDMARLICGRLRAGNVPGYTLEILKRELRDFNTRTGVWRP